MASGTGNLPNPGMDFTPFDILTAEEMDDLVENIESLADGTGIGDGALKKGAVDWSTSGGIWWEELGRTTLGSAGNTISVTGIPPRKYLHILITALDSGSNISVGIQFNGDTGNNYVRRYSVNNGSDTTGAATSSLLSVTSGATISLTTLEILNIANHEKLVIGQSVARNNTGTGVNPDKFEVAGKWVNTSQQINRIDVISGNNFAPGSELVVLGHD